jgi:PAS domain S-box-containing protein
VRLNRAGEDLLGWPRQRFMGKSDYDFWPQAQADFFVQKDRETLKRGAIVDISEEPIQTRHQGVRILHTKKVPILDTAGNPIYLLGISEDITERSRIEKEQRFLAEASVVLSASLDHEQTLATVARLAVQHVADWCVVDVMEEQGQLRRLKVASSDPAKAALCVVLEQMPPDRDLPHLMRSVMESKRPMVVEHVTSQYLDSLAQGPEHLQALLAAGILSFRRGATFAAGTVPRRDASRFLDAVSRFRAGRSPLGRSTSRPSGCGNRKCTSLPRFSPRHPTPRSSAGHRGS